MVHDGSVELPLRGAAFADVPMTARDVVLNWRALVDAPRATESTFAIPSRW